MAFENLEAKLRLDASDFIAEADEAAAATEELGDTAATASESFVDVDRAGAAAGGALAGLGTAAQKALDDTKDLRSTTAQTAITMGTTQDEVNDLAKEVSNMTLPMEDAVGAMEAFSNLGVENEQRMKDLTTAADSLADATGSSATTVAQEVAPVMRALDGDLESLEETSDAMTIAVHNSTLELSDLSSTISKLDFSRMEEMGLQTQELTGLITKFAEESGYTGRQLRSNFRQAIENADGSQQKLIENLGLSENALEEWNQQVEESAGVTEEYAEAGNSSLDATDKLRARFDELKLEAAEMLEPINAAAPAMQSLGGAALTMSTVNFSAVAPSFAAVASAAGPLLVPLLAIAAALGALYVAWDRNFLGIQDIVRDSVSRMRDHLDPLISVLRDEFLETVEVWKSGIMDAMEPVQEAWAVHGDEITAVLDLLMRAWETYVLTVIEFVVALGRTLLALLRGDTEAIEEIWQDFFDNTSELWAGLGDEIFDVLPTREELVDRGESLVDSLIEGIKNRIGAVGDAAADVAGRVRSKFPGSDAEEGPLDDITDSFASIPEIAEEEMADNADRASEGGRAVASAASEATEVATAGSGGGGSTEVQIEFANGATEALWDVLEPYVEVAVDGETEKKARQTSLQTAIDPS